MRTLLVTSLALTGCMKTNPVYCEHHPEDTAHCNGMMIDAAGTGDGKKMDAPPIDAPDCFGSGAFAVCPKSAATGTKTVTGTFDTGNANPMCNSMQLWQGTGQTSSCFVVAATITVQNLNVTGTRPLVLVASGDINITGHLNAASHLGGTEGPGALNPGTCGTFGNVGNVVPAGGGAGASFVAAGGAGGSGGGGDNNNNPGGSGYAPFVTTPPGTLRAGCRGQTGGTGQGSGGIGGFGGGALYIASATSITMGASAIVNASGAGGGQAGKTAGGGGGGSGGMIILYAPTFSITNGAIVVANGGSGSTGGDGNGAGNGVAGNDPDPTNPMTPAPGPMGVGGKGGAGFAQGSLATGGGNGASGEGGGGGGAGGGYIQSNMALTNAKVSPTANIVQ